MSTPQQPELARSRKTPHQDPDSAAALVETRGPLPGGEPGGPVPPENQPGHHPEKEQDKPDLDAFAERLGISDGNSGDGGQSADGSPAGPRAVASSAVSRVTNGSRGRTAAIAGALAVLVGLLLRRRRRRTRARS